MGITLVIAREDTLVVYEQVNGLFSEVASIILTHKLNDDAVVQIRSRRLNRLRRSRSRRRRKRRRPRGPITTRTTT
jgi:hypothetical protein